MTVAISIKTSPEQLLPTIISAIMISSILTGIFLFVMGHFKMGNLFRFIPYPVMGGYFAGAGFLLVTGAFPVMLGTSLSLENLDILLQTDQLILWLPGILLAIFMYGIEQKFDHYLLMPGILLVGVIVFYISLFLTGTSIFEAKNLGLLFSNFPSGNMVPPVNLSLLQNTDFPVIGSQFLSIVTIILLSAITLLLNTSGLELGIGKDLDLDKELKVSGIANIATGLLGGVVSFHEDMDTLLSYKLGAKHRASGILYALVCGLVIFIGREHP